MRPATHLTTRLATTGLRWRTTGAKPPRAPRRPPARPRSLPAPDLSEDGTPAARAPSPLDARAAAAALLEGGQGAAADAGAARFDAILVLGGGLTPAGACPPWVIRRLDAAAAIRGMQAVPVPIAILGAGTPHKAPPIDSASGRELWECTAGARYLAAAHGLDLRGRGGGRGGGGPPPPHPALPPVLKEAASYDTVGNALFALTTHALPAEWSRLAVVTSSWHAPRARAIFDTVFGLANRAFRAGGGPPGAPPPFRLDYFPTADDDLFPADILQARAAREATSTAAWARDTARLASLRDLHAWVHATHACYAAGRQDEGRGVVNEGVDPKALASY